VIADVADVEIAVVIELDAMGLIQGGFRCRPAIAKVAPVPMPATVLMIWLCLHAPHDTVFSSRRSTCCRLVETDFIRFIKAPLRAGHRTGVAAFAGSGTVEIIPSRITLRIT